MPRWHFLFLAKKGNTCDTIAAKTQCVRLPSDIPFALTELGKISEIKTQITAPCPIACAAINKKTYQVIPPCDPEEKEKAINDKEII